MSQPPTRRSLHAGPPPAPQLPTRRSLHAGPPPAPQPPPAGQQRGNQRRKRRSAGDWITTIIGELLVTCGVFIALFLVWQLWYTNLEAAENNRAAAAQLEQRFSPPVKQKVVESAKRHTDAPPVVQARGLNQPYAKLYIPKWGKDYMVTIAEGLDYTAVLNHGLVGHYPESNAIGELGNAGLAAHRMTRGAVFQHIEDLEAGDEVIVESEKAWIVYKVTSTEVITPDQGEVLYPVPHQLGAEPEHSLLTLTTCHPLMSTRERYVVYSEFSYWIDRADGMPDALLEDN